MAFEILGVNLLEIIKRYEYKGIPLPIMRVLAKQCLIGLDYLNRVCKLIHTDLKPENVVIALTQAQLKEIYNNGYLKTSTMKRHPEKAKRIIAGGGDEVLISSKNPKARDLLSPRDTPRVRQTSQDKYEQMDQKAKKKYRKNK